MSGTSIAQLPLRLGELLEGEEIAVCFARALEVLPEFGIEPSAVDAAEVWLALDFGAGIQRWSAPPAGDELQRLALASAKSQLLLGARLVRECERQRRTDERLEMLSQASFEGIMIHVDGVIVDCNQRLAEMLGYDYSEVIGAQTMRLCVAPEDYPAVLDRLAKRLRDHWHPQRRLAFSRRDPRQTGPYRRAAGARRSRARRYGA